MTIVNQYTIIYFYLVIHATTSLYINRNICLETVVRFIHHQDKCEFDSSTAEDILQDVTTCPNECNFQMFKLTDRKYSLKRIQLTISDEIKWFYPCSDPESSRKERSLYINCASWNTSKYITWNDDSVCSITNAQCFQIYNYCVCHCLPGYILEDYNCLKGVVKIGGICEYSWQCVGAGLCNHTLCSCSSGYTQIDGNCYPGNLELNDSCELTEQCLQPFTVCFKGKCKCISGYSAFDTDSCIKDTVPVGGFCNLSQQCTGSNNSGICENGICTCAKEFTAIDFACEKKLPNSLGIGSSNSQQHDTNIGLTLGSLFGGFTLGAIVTAVVTILMYRRLKCRTRRREEPDVMFADNRTYGGAREAQISFTNRKKQNVATLSPYSFAKKPQGYNLSSKQGDERTEDVYNHLREQTEQDGDTYDHASAAQNHSTDLSDYSYIHDAATFRPPLSEDGDDYSTSRH